MNKDLPEVQTNSVDEDRMRFEKHWYGRDNRTFESQEVIGYAEAFELWKAAKADSQAEIDGLQAAARFWQDKAGITNEQLSTANKRIAELEALLKEKDDALRWCADIYKRDDLQKWLNISWSNICDSYFEAIQSECQRAISHTSPTDALDRYRKEVLEEATDKISAMYHYEAASVQLLRRMVKGE